MEEATLALYERDNCAQCRILPVHIHRQCAVDSSDALCRRRTYERPETTFFNTFIFLARVAPTHVHTPTRPGARRVRLKTSSGRLEPRERLDRDSDVRLARHLSRQSEHVLTRAKCAPWTRALRACPRSAARSASDERSPSLSHSVKGEETRRARVGVRAVRYISQPSFPKNQYRVDRI